MAYIVKAVFGSESIVKTDTIYQYNSGQVLQVEGLAFTNSTEFHLAIHGKDTASIITGTIANNIAKITIPEVLMINDFCTCNYRIDVFVYVIDNDSGYTKYKIIIPVKSRPRPKDYYVDLPTVPELKSLKQELNTAVNNFNDAYTEIDQLKSETASLKEDLDQYLIKDNTTNNIFDSSKVENGCRYNSVTGERIVSNDYFTSDFIPFKFGDILRWSMDGADWFKQSITLWDQNKKIITNEKATSDFTTVESKFKTFSGYENNPLVDVWKSAKYFRVSFYYTSASNKMIVKNIDFPNEFIPYGEGKKYSDKLTQYIKSAATDTSFDNKTILFSGDSIMAGLVDDSTHEKYNTLYGWVEMIGEKHVLSKCINYGIGGTTIAKQNGKTNSILERLEKMYTEHPNADAIILEGGVNDCYTMVLEDSTKHIVLGEISNGYNAELDESTFSGAMESLLKNAIAKWQGKFIGFIGVHKVPSAMVGACDFKAYMQRAKEICEKWSVPYLDLFNESGLCYHLDEIKQNFSYGNGGLHPNIEGYKVDLQKIDKWIERNIH